MAYNVLGKLTLFERDIDFLSKSGIKDMDNEQHSMPPSLMIGMKEFARLMSMSPSLLGVLEKQGQIGPEAKVFGRSGVKGRRRFWRRAEVEAWTEAGCPGRKRWKSIQEKPKC